VGPGRWCRWRADAAIGRTRIQYRPHLIAGCLPTTGLDLDGLIDEPNIADST